MRITAASLFFFVACGGGELGRLFLRVRAAWVGGGVALHSLWRIWERFGEIALLFWEGVR